MFGGSTKKFIEESIFWRDQSKLNICVDNCAPPRLCIHLEQEKYSLTLEILDNYQFVCHVKIFPCLCN